MRAEFLQTKFVKKTIICICMFALVSLFLPGCSGNTKPPALKSAEITTPTIKEAGTLRVGVNTSQAPLAGQGNSKIIGIDVDIASAIADSLGLKVKIVDIGSSSSKAITNGDVDVVLGVDSSDVPKSTKLSDKYLSTGVALFAAKNGGKSIPGADSNPKVAAQTSSKSAWATTNVFGKESLVSQSDLSAAFQSMNSGSVDYVASDAIIGLYSANKAEVSATPIALLDNASGYCAAVSQDNSDLLDKINSKLKELVNNGTLDIIEKKWLGDAVDISSLEKISKASNDNEKESGSSQSEAVKPTENAPESSEINNSNTDSTAQATDANKVKTN